MAGPVPAIYVFAMHFTERGEVVDGRAKPGQGN